MAKVRRKQDSTIVTLDNIPLQGDFTFCAKGVITMLENTKAFVTYSGDLSSSDYKKFLKEMLALFKDFDDIYGEILEKYKLVKENE